MTIRRIFRLRWLLALSLAAATLGALPAKAAPLAAGPPYNTAQWAAWHLSASFASGAPVVTFTAYVGKGNSPPVVLGQLVEDISTACLVRGAPALAIDAAGYANFDGTVYLECATPDWSAMIGQLAPHLASANPACECESRRSPFWASADLILNPVPNGTLRANPLIDAGGAGFGFSMPTNGPLVRSQLTRSSGSFRSAPWAYDSVGGNRLLVGQNGPVDTAIIKHLGGLSYLTNSGWQTYFEHIIKGDRLGQWLEPANTGSYVQIPTRPFTLVNGPGTVYIGRNNSTGELLHGKLRNLDGDPGCFG